MHRIMLPNPGQPTKRRRTKIQLGGEKTPTPSAKWRLPATKVPLFPENGATVRQLSLAGGGGWRDEKILDLYANSGELQVLTAVGGGRSPGGLSFRPGQVPI